MPPSSSYRDSDSDIAHSDAESIPIQALVEENSVLVGEYTDKERASRRASGLMQKDDLVVRAISAFVFRKDNKLWHPTVESVNNNDWEGVTCTGFVASLSGPDDRALVSTGYWDLPGDYSVEHYKMSLSPRNFYVGQSKFFRNKEWAYWFDTQQYAYVLAVPEESYVKQWKFVCRAKWHNKGIVAPFEDFHSSSSAPSWWPSSDIERFYAVRRLIKLVEEGANSGSGAQAPPTANTSRGRQAQGAAVGKGKAPAASPGSGSSRVTRNRKQAVVREPAKVGDVPAKASTTTRSASRKIPVEAEPRPVASSSKKGPTSSKIGKSKPKPKPVPSSSGLPERSPKTSSVSSSKAPAVHTVSSSDDDVPSAPTKSSGATGGGKRLPTMAVVIPVRQANKGTARASPQPGPLTQPLTQETPSITQEVAPRPETPSRDTALPNLPNPSDTVQAADEEPSVPTSDSIPFESVPMAAYIVSSPPRTSPERSPEVSQQDPSLIEQTPPPSVEMEPMATSDLVPLQLDASIPIDVSSTPQISPEIPPEATQPGPSLPERISTPPVEMELGNVDTEAGSQSIVGQKRPLDSPVPNDRAGFPPASRIPPESTLSEAERARVLPLLPEVSYENPEDAVITTDQDLSPEFVSMGTHISLFDGRLEFLVKALGTMGQELALAREPWKLWHDVLAVGHVKQIVDAKLVHAMFAEMKIRRVFTMYACAAFIPEPSRGPLQKRLVTRVAHFVCLGWFNNRELDVWVKIQEALRDWRLAFEADPANAVAHLPNFEQCFT